MISPLSSPVVVAAKQNVPFQARVCVEYPAGLTQDAYISNAHESEQSKVAKALNVLTSSFKAQIEKVSRETDLFGTDQDVLTIQASFNDRGHSEFNAFLNGEALLIKSMYRPFIDSSELPVLKDFMNKTMSKLSRVITLRDAEGGFDKKEVKVVQNKQRLIPYQEVDLVKQAEHPQESKRRRFLGFLGVE